MGSDTICINMLVPPVFSQKLYPSPLPSGPLPDPEMARPPPTTLPLAWPSSGPCPSSLSSSRSTPSLHPALELGGALSSCPSLSPCLTPTVLSGTLCLQSILHPPHLFLLLVPMSCSQHLKPEDAPHDQQAGAAVPLLLILNLGNL